jgi:hypothetical protein
MNRSAIFLILLLSFGLSEGLAQAFSFQTTMRAGLPGGGDWEIGLGSPTAAQLSTAQFGYEARGQQYWRDNGLPQDFRIGWDAVGRQAYTIVYNSQGQEVRLNYANTGVLLREDAIWTLPATGFWAQATPRGNDPSSIQLENLTLAPNVVLRSGSLPASFGASQTGTVDYRALSSPLVLDASGNQGSWYVAGQIRFSGLTSQGGGAQRSTLQFFLNATGENTPEPETMGLIGAGLVLMGMVHRSRRNGKSV